MAMQDTAANKIKWKAVAIGVGIVALIVILIIVFEDGGGSDEKYTSGETVNPIIQELLGGMTENDYIIQGETVDKQLQEQLQVLSDTVLKLQQNMEHTSAENERLKREVETLNTQMVQFEENAKAVIDAQIATISRLENDRHSRSASPLDSTGSAEAINASVPPTMVQNSPFNSTDPFVVNGNTADSDGGDPLGIDEQGASSKFGSGLVEFALSGTDTGVGRRLKEYLPAGSYVSAVIISGADAGVGTRFKSDPKPVLIRVTDKAKTVAFEGGSPQQIDLRGCMITGSATGDLSSEKVYIRTITMTCSFSEGKANEYQVHGYAAGTGKSGIRGPVISREGDLVEKSFIAGLVSGLGDGVNQAFQPSGSTTTTGNRTTLNDDRSRTQKLTDSFGAGIGTGFKNSADRISQYLIERAEQYQPVISLQSGTKVEVVFLQGVHLQQPYAAANNVTQNGE